MSKEPETLLDPLQTAEKAAQSVCRGDRRKYYRFRPAGFYGGIATADCLGCCLRCVFCWSGDKVVRPARYGKLYSPTAVAEKLSAIAFKKGFRQVRISGNEPTLAREHLFGVLARIPEHLLFILETNGILLGSDPGYARGLSRFENLHVRVSLKGANEEEFAALTGMEPLGFRLQLDALDHLARHGVSAHPAVMVSFSEPDGVESLTRRLREIHPGYGTFEAEELALYGKVEEQLRSAGLLEG